MKRRILVADDNDKIREQMQKLLEADGEVQVDTVGDGEKALAALGKEHYSIFLTDLKMPGRDGIRLIEEVQKRQIPVTSIVMTGFGSVSDAVQAMRLGAADFLTKPVDPDHLRLVVQRALRERTLQDELAALREEVRNRYSFEGIISKNPRMLAVFELIGNVAETTTTILIEGETGTGKEIIARAIHQTSSKIRQGPMVAVNCVAMPESLMESELFGHEKGAFTSAIGRRQGRFEMANGGTLFLDEIGDMPLPMQAKLLRVLQERRFERVGGSESIEVDVRVIAATNQRLEKLIKKAEFREDLYYRLNVVKIELPPLRERPEDIPLLASHFAAKYARPGEPPKKVSPQAMQVLLGYRWPGNIRELENTIERASVTARGDSIEAEHLPPNLLAPTPPSLPFKIDLERPLPELIRDVTADVEKQYIRKALQKSHGNVSRCARLCGLSRRSITAKLAEYKIDKSTYKED
jgi:DNA-binding NtrC family response regulator